MRDRIDTMANGLRMTGRLIVILPDDMIGDPTRRRVNDILAVEIVEAAARVRRRLAEHGLGDAVIATGQEDPHFLL